MATPPRQQQPPPGGPHDTLDRPGFEVDDHPDATPSTRSVVVISIACADSRRSQLPLAMARGMKVLWVPFFALTGHE